MIHIGANIYLGLLAGGTIYIGLLAARLRAMSDTLRAVLALLSAGILIFLTVEVGYHSFESVETAFRLGKAWLGVGSLLLVVLGLGLGLVALGAYEDSRCARRSCNVTPLDLAWMTAIGIGVHNFGEGLAIGQSYASGAAALGASLVAGFALHNATEGFGIVGALRGERIGWGKIGLLGLIGGGPTVVGSVVGGFWTNGMLVTFCYALAAGSLLYVIRELLRIPFKLASRWSLSAVTAGLLIGLLTETVVESVQAIPAIGKAGAPTVEIIVADGKFVPASLTLPTGANLVIRNPGKKVYTLEGPTILKGDMPVDAGGKQTVVITAEPGDYTIFAEEDTKMTLPVKVTATGSEPVAGGDPRIETVKLARATGRQPVIFPDIGEPQFGAYTAFNLTVRGEGARQKLLKDLSDISQEITADQPPGELAQYFTRGSWEKLRPSVALVYGLGPSCYDPARFGARVAASKPADLHEIYYAGHLHFNAKKTQKDVIVRVTSDSLWFNQQVCRYAWRKLAGRIDKDSATLDFGYSTPNGRSPLLGGFFDGTGNPIGKMREEAVFGPNRFAAASNGTYMSWFKIRFDQDRFASHPLKKQQEIIGRIRQTGRQLPGDNPASHRSKTEGDSSRSILRQAFVFDNSPKDTGLIFASLEASLTNQLEGILCGFMMNAAAPTPGAGTDRLMDYMHFVEGGYYYIPPAPQNGFPGAL